MVIIPNCHTKTIFFGWLMTVVIVRVSISTYKYLLSFTQVGIFQRDRKNMQEICIEIQVKGHEDDDRVKRDSGVVRHLFINWKKKNTMTNTFEHDWHNKQSLSLFLPVYIYVQIVGSHQSGSVVALVPASVGLRHRKQHQTPLWRLKHAHPANEMKVARKLLVIV